MLCLGFTLKKTNYLDNSDGGTTFPQCSSSTKQQRLARFVCPNVTDCCRTRTNQNEPKRLQLASFCGNFRQLNQRLFIPIPVTQPIVGKRSQQITFATRSSSALRQWYTFSHISYQNHHSHHSGHSRPFASAESSAVSPTRAVYS